MTLRRPPKMAAFVGLLTALLLTGCSSPPVALTVPTRAGAGTAGVSTARPASSSACVLVTEPELATLLGSDPGPGKDSSDGSTTSCLYTGAGAVSIVVDHGVSSGQLAMYCGLTASGPNTQQLTGVADGGCFTIVGGPIAVLYVLKGTELMSINIQAGLDTKITAAGLTALGTTAAGRL